MRVLQHLRDAPRCQAVLQSAGIPALDPADQDPASNVFIVLLAFVHLSGWNLRFINKNKSILEGHFILLVHTSSLTCVSSDDFSVFAIDVVSLLYFVR